MFAMKRFKLPLILFAISPALSLYRAWRAADAQVKGLLSDADAQRQLLTNVAYAGVVYLICTVLCLRHLWRNAGMGGLRKALWTVGLVLFPVVFAPAYLLLHAGR